ncbi:hypothetical protein BFP76_09810 [Amylibacter kogurei]|uniref:Egg lysin n=1 Tax=Paramylibacter kogurei TaxID=1889778 RepID=A0A2G5K1P3_9RHOB|nr:DUF3422 domain-containing protein [Amylibacter kogurei]PIB22820.1 hypothetical protein BFP76_09810 [Amylibacter kogurei]
MSSVENHSLRYGLANELHARPFPQVDAPSVVGYVAFTDDGDHHKFLSELLQRFGATAIPRDATHHFCELGGAVLKWEKHTEFVTYTLIKPIAGDVGFDIAGYDLFPQDWLATVQSKVITSVSVVVHPTDATKNVEKTAQKFFADNLVSESLSVSYVVDKTAVVASDFRIDTADNIRFVIYPIGQVGRNRLGRILQRLLEIETYKSMSMLTLPIARQVFAQLEDLDAELSNAVDGLSDEQGSSQEALEKLLSISARIEELISKHAFRFSAARAYSTLVNQRISVLREERFLGRQTFSEFMMRRFDPAMRTCEAASERLKDISLRSARASDLLSTRVSVRQSSQNQRILARMDERADIQLRLQETVEGLSIVAISYYAVSLMSYLLSPIGSNLLGWEKHTITAMLVLPVMIVVAIAVRRIRNRLMVVSK